MPLKKEVQKKGKGKMKLPTVGTPVMKEKLKSHFE